MKLFPAFRTRSFFEEKSKKGAQTIASIGAKPIYEVLLITPYFFNLLRVCLKIKLKRNSRHAEFISASHQQEKYGKLGCETEINSV
ncbi:hypothetical protein [Tenacibaculum piscium]|uniref:hypothetical protein n=1 Tax=Tenacibaculum piscium TaxID=1458515 RepID=UPI001EFAC23A|nr:hypothetical protein [Tenacibaculum piscium]MCG8182767.1 hypothetical protein [Tenacibaculum piscium]MCG8204159.1 hypothetical protein [Tenacibaculum piscium]